MLISVSHPFALWPLGDEANSTNEIVETSAWQDDAPGLLLLFKTDYSDELKPEITRRIKNSAGSSSKSHAEDWVCRDDEPITRNNVSWSRNNMEQPIRPTCSQAKTASSFKQITLTITLKLTHIP